MYLNKKLLLPVLLLFIIAGLTACQSGSKKPGLRQGRIWIEQHFANDTYKNLIEVMDVELVDAVEETYQEGQYRSLKLQATIEVKEDYVISRLFTFNSFEVSEQWPINFEAQIAAAQSDEEKERIRNTFNTYAFSKGHHDITVYIEYILMDDAWQFFSSNISAIGLEENVMMPS